MCPWESLLQTCAPCPSIGWAHAACTRCADQSDTVPACAGLEHLNMGGNSLHEVPAATLACLTSLTYLQLQRNYLERLETMPGAIEATKSPADLVMDDYFAEHGTPCPALLHYLSFDLDDASALLSGTTPTCTLPTMLPPAHHLNSKALNQTVWLGKLC